ncbi:V-type ATP synthase subunit E [bacterium]|nr:V-type ATP synthase subunit E [bacterium]
MNSQSVDVLCEKIIGEAKIEAETILNKAEKMSRQRIKLTEQQVKNESVKLRKSAEQRSEFIKKKILSSLNLEKKKLVLNKQELFTKKILADVKNLIFKFTEYNKYRSVLKELVIEAVSTLNEEGTVMLQFGKSDPHNAVLQIVRDAEKILNQKYGKKINLKIHKQRHFQHGVIASINDGLISVTNTLEERLASKNKEIRTLIYENLFKGD